MKWAKSKIVVCFLIVIMLSVFSLRDIAVFKSIARINTMIAVLSVFSSTPAYATNGSDFYPDCSAEEAAVVAATAVATAAASNLLSAETARNIATLAFVAALFSESDLLIEIAAAALVAAWIWLGIASRNYNNAVEAQAAAVTAYNTCRAGAGGEEEGGGEED